MIALILGVASAATAAPSEEQECRVAAAQLGVFGRNVNPSTVEIIVELDYDYEVTPTQVFCATDDDTWMHANSGIVIMLDGSLATYQNTGTIYGGPGDEVVHFNLGTLYGRGGDDAVAANSGTFYGGPGNDHVGSNYGEFYGGDGDDWVLTNRGVFMD